MEFFRCTVGGSGKGNTVTVTCAEEFAGLTITLSKTGKTYTKTCPSTAPYVVTFNGVENGTYTVSCTVDGQTYSETVIVQDVSCVLNYGFKWQAWVDTASQLDSSDYDSLDEVLADEKALRELFLEHACVDYIAENAVSDTNLETIIENDLCAKWINLSDYALDFLGANTVIKALMDEADKYGYGEWTLMPQVPKMTSNTAPFGEAISSSVSGTNSAYKAFDGDDSTFFQASSELTPSSKGYVGFIFTNALIAKKATITFYNNSGYNFTYYASIKGSNDGITWSEELGSADTGSIADQVSKQLDITLTNSIAYTYYKADVWCNTSGSAVRVKTLQFYAWAPKGNVPVMTGNTAPYGTVFSSSESSGNESYRAFDSEVDSTTMWTVSATGTSYTNLYLGYSFTNPINAQKVRIRFGSDISAQRYVVQGSNDKSTWVDLAEGTDTTGVLTIELSNDSYYLHYRLVIVTQTLTASYLHGGRVQFLQFYGRELKVSVPIMTSNTTPYGEASSSGSASGREPWRAFSGVAITSSNLTTSTWIGSNVGQSVQYQFPSKIVPKMAKFATMRSSGSSTMNVTFSGGNDGSFTNIGSATATVSATRSQYVVNLNNDNNEYRALRLLEDNNSQYAIGELQFYGLDYSEKEFEVGTTKKWIYDHGLLLNNFTWDDTATYSTGSYTRQGTITDNSNGFRMLDTKSGTGYTYLSRAVNEQIDFSAYNSLRYSKSIGDVIDSGIDVSSVAAQYYIGIFVVHNDSNSTRVNRIYVTSQKTLMSNNSVASLSSTGANPINDINELWLE